MDYRIEFLPWESCLDLVKNAKADAIFSLNRTAEREEYLLFPKECNALSQSVFFKRKGSSLRFDSYADLSDLRIGVIDGYEYSGGFMDQSGFTRVPSKSNEINLKRVAEGTIDLCICDKYLGLHAAKELGILDVLVPLERPVNQSELFTGFARTEGNTALVLAFDKAMKQLKTSGDYEKILTRLLKA
jgi:ABC-type amino acid transport substrate-binding protein